LEIGMFGIIMEIFLKKLYKTIYAFDNIVRIKIKGEKVNATKIYKIIYKKN
jgi:hypothetical protein